MERVFWRAVLMALTLTVPWMLGFHPAVTIGTIVLCSASLLWFGLAIEREIEQREWLEATVANLLYLREQEEMFPVTGHCYRFAGEPEAVEA